MENLRFKLGDRVTLKESNEEGEVIGRAEYSTGEPCFHLRYCAADGRQVESWWSDSSIR